MAFWKTIYFKIISICMGILLIIMVMIGFVHREANLAIQREYMNSLDGSFRFSAETFERELQNAVMTLNIISVDDSVRRYMYNYEVLSVYERHALNEDVSALFSKFTYMNGIIKNIGIVTRDRTRELSYLGDRKPAGFFPDEMESVLYEKDGRLFIVQGEKRRNAASAIFYVEFDRDYFESLAASIDAVVPGAEIAFVEGDKAIYRTCDATFRDAAILEMNALRQADGYRFKYKDKRIFSYSVYLNSMKLYIGFQDDLLADSVKKLDNINYVVFLLIFLQAVLLVLYVHAILNKPMKKLVSLMEEIGRGNLDAEAGEITAGQFGFIFRGFQDMRRDLAQYIRSNYEQKLEIERIELKQLQAQINPHFLYNCFFNISKLCKIEDTDTAMLFSQKLAAYYMYITRNGRDEVMLKEEYCHAADYLEIQSIRFYDRVTVRMEELTREQERLRVPRTILQPILENCYKYVFERQEGKGQLHIRCEYRQDILLLSIEDSGLGDSRNLPEEMNRRLREAIGSGLGESTGIVNVCRRLKLKNSDNDLWVEKSDLGGIRVVLKIVYGKREEVQDVPTADCGR